MGKEKKGVDRRERVLDRRGSGGTGEDRGWDMRGRRWDSRKIPHLDSPIVDSQLGGELRYPEQQATVTFHLCFKQAQPKMCHSPKVDDGVDIFFKTS